jgi:hypothetical protein
VIRKSFLYSVFWIILIAFIFTCVVQVRSSARQSIVSDDSRERVVRASRSGSPDDLEFHMSQFVSSKSTHEMRDLVCDPNDTIALCSGWERVLRTIPGRKDHAIIKIDEQVVSRFIGLIEGRIHVPIPVFWEKAMNAAKDYGDFEIGFSHPEFFKKSYVISPDFKRNNDIWAIQLDEERVTFSTQSQIGSVDGVAVHFTSEIAYVALYAGRPVPYSLLAINRLDKKILWDAKVWAGGNRNYTGYGLHFSELRLAGKNILVFGVSEGAAYIDGFDATTGINVFRFSTSYLESVVRIKK